MFGKVYSTVVLEHSEGKTNIMMQVVICYTKFPLQINQCHQNTVAASVVY